MTSRYRMISILACGIVIIVITAFLFQRTQGFESHYSAGERLYLEKSYSRALAAFSAAHARNPLDEKTSWYLFLTYSKLNRKKEAEAQLSDLKRHIIKDSGILAELGSIHYSRNSFGEAERSYAASLAVKENPDIRRKYAEVLVWQKKYKRALFELDHILLIKPADKVLRELKADVLSWDGQHVKALVLYHELYQTGYHKNEILKKITQLSGSAVHDSSATPVDGLKMPEKDSGYQGAGNMIKPQQQKHPFVVLSSLSVDQSRNKEERFLKLLGRDPYNKALLREAVSTYESSGNPEKALPYYERLLDTYPGDTSLALAAAKTYAWAGRYPRALQLYSRVIQNGQGSDRIREEYADVLYWDMQYTLAIAEYQLLWKKGVLKKTQALNFSRALMASREYVSAAEIIDFLTKRYPEDVEVLEARADVCFALKQYDRAEKLYRDLTRSKPENPAYYNRVADIFVAKHDYQQAIAISLDILRRFPDNENALLTIARVSSWQKDYSLSLEYYDRLLASAHSGPQYYREKARVLGWTRAYGKSLRLYKEAIRSYPENQALKAESEAKKYYYRNTWNHAVKNYRAWLLAEPHHPEALFDLGQLFFQQARWKEASEIYDTLLIDIPDHPQATVVRKKISVLSSLTRLESGVDYFSARSAQRLNDVTWSGFHTALDIPIHERETLFMKLDRKNYRFENGRHTPFSNVVTAGFDYRNQPDIHLRAAYGFKQNSGNLADSHTGFIEAGSMPLDNLHLDFGFHREEVIENYTTFLNHLQKNRWQGRVHYDGFRRLNAGADYALERYSDGNSRANIGIDLMAHLMYEPKRLSVTYRWQNYGFSDHRAEYFSPATFTTHTAGIEWQHSLNSEELFRGANDTYYTAAYRISLEPGSSLSHQVHAGIYKDWSKRFSGSLDYQHTWNSKTEIYKDDQINAGIMWYF
ncbi:MAG: tetratricopeptide repeat protein [Chlorobiaceae bacterium]|nr:tetratricopeptide repeat protein [Chlorobiaceae bacterium]